MALKPWESNTNGAYDHEQSVSRARQGAAVMMEYLDAKDAALDRAEARVAELEQELENRKCALFSSGHT